MFEVLGAWADPLSTLSLSLAASIYIYKALAVPLWLMSPFAEQNALNHLYVCQTLGEARTLLRQPGIPHGGQSRHERLHFFVLNRTYVNLAVDELGAILGYSIAERRPSLMGPIDVGGVSARLGRTSLTDAWRWVRPSYAAQAASRSYGYIEASAPSGVSTYVTWAVGYTSMGHTWKARKIWRVLRPRPSSDFLVSLWQDLPMESWHDRDINNSDADPAIEAARKMVRANVLAVTFNGDMMHSILMLHDQAVFLLDRQQMLRRVRLF